MKILITGVYGIIGSYLCEKLRNEGFFIVGIGKKKVIMAVISIIIVIL